jgi:hypothetical protein
MHDVVRQYERVRKVPETPGGDIDSKIDYGLGRAWMCLGRAGEARSRDKAREPLRRVTQQYHDGTERLRELASEAYAAQALSDFPMEGDADLTKQYSKAAEQYEEAIRYGHNPDRLASFNCSLADIRDRLGQEREAAAAYRAWQESRSLARTPAGRKPCPVKLPRPA